MYHEQFNHLIREVSKKIVNYYFETLAQYPEFENDKEVDTSPLLNLTTSVFLTCILRTLDFIKENTKGEEKLISNIELTQKGLNEFFKSLPFVSKVEEVDFMADDTRA